MRVLGVDPGLTRCGLGIVEGGLGQPLRMIAVGVVRTPTTDAPEERLGLLMTGGGKDPRPGEPGARVLP